MFPNRRLNLEPMENRITPAVNFSPAATLAIGPSPSSIVTGDFNGDGNVDLVTGNSPPNGVSVLLGDGLGGFASPIKTNIGLNQTGSGFARTVQVGDFNGDKKLDVVYTTPGANEVSVLFGNGFGGFTKTSQFAVDTDYISPTPAFFFSETSSVVVDDFNGDGKSDLATVVNTNSVVSVLIGNGLGGFTKTVDFNLERYSAPDSIASGDFNGDGNRDVAVGSRLASTVIVLFGDGAGGFTKTSTFASVSPVGLTAGDINGDGKTDLVSTGGKEVGLLFGDGLGGFAPSINFTVGDYAQDVISGDFNGDGLPDLATANAESDDVSVLLGDGLGGFGKSIQFAVGDTPVSLTVGDFNGDGFADIATANRSSNNVSVLLNSSKFGAVPINQPLALAPLNGNLPITIVDPQTGAQQQVPNPLAGFGGTVDVAVGDLNGDGIADLIVAAGAGGTPRVVAVDGATGQILADFNAFDASFRGGVHLAVGDVTGDGRADIIVGASAGGGPNVRVFGGPTFTLLMDVLVYSESFGGGVTVAVGDINGDGRADIIVGAGAGGGAHIKVIDFQTVTYLKEFFAFDAGFTGGVNIAAGDVTGDGIVDIITGAGNGGGSNVRVYRGSDLDLETDYFAYERDLSGGVSVAVGRLAGVSQLAILTGTGTTAGARVRGFDGLSGLPVFDQFLDDASIPLGVDVG